MNLKGMQANEQKAEIARGPALQFSHDEIEAWLTDAADQSDIRVQWPAANELRRHGPAIIRQLLDELDEHDTVMGNIRS